MAELQPESAPAIQHFLQWKSRTGILKTGCGGSDNTIGSNYISHAALREYLTTDRIRTLLKGPEEFVEYKKQRTQEEEDRRLHQRVAHLLNEKEDQKKEAERKQKELEDEILRKHSAEQAEVQNRNAAKKEMLRNELEKAGIEAQQIETILASSTLDYSALSESTVKPSGIISPQESLTGKNRRFRTRSRSRDSFNQKSVKWSLRLPWRHKKESQPNERSLGPSFTPKSDELYRWPATRFNTAAFDIDTWLFDVYTQAKTRIPPSRKWIEVRWAKMLKNGDVWNDFAHLKPMWRTSILQFLTPMSEKGWFLLSVEVPQRSPSMRLFGSRVDDPLVQLVLSRRRVTAAPRQSSSPLRDDKNPNDKPTRIGKYRPRANIENPQVRFQDTDSSYGSDEASEKASRSRRNSKRQARTEENTAAYGRWNRPSDGPKPLQQHTHTTTYFNQPNRPYLGGDTTEPSGKRYDEHEGSRLPPQPAPPRPQPSRRNHDEHALGTPMGLESPELDDSSEELSLTQRRKAYNGLSRLQQLQQQQLQQQQRQQPRHGGIPTNQGAEGVRPEHINTFNAIADSSSPREPNVDTARLDQDRDLAVRPGGSRRLEDYMQERVRDDGIRVRGYDIPGSVVGSRNRSRRLPTSVKPMWETNTERRWSLARELRRSKTHRGSEDENDGSIESCHEQPSSEDKFKDEETIVSTLKKYTTFQADATPIDAIASPNSPASTPSSSAPKEVQVQASEVQNGEAHRNRLSQDSDMPLASTAVGVPGQAPLSIGKEDVEPDQSKGSTNEELTADQISDFPDLEPGVIQNEPPELTEEVLPDSS
ncbi:MAG: hypothetical protein Q9207_000433 [Kuettlingeria erythrocarpa]